ncbi:MAG: mechanosensitive ion channel [Alphaproteobacteria bacterium]|nr:mechanosensitive ion channel [Alphaproteobacteria bacterium]
MAPIKILTDRLEAVLRDAIAIAPNVIAAMVFLTLTWLVARTVRWTIRQLLRSRRFRPALREAVQTVSSVLIWLIGLLVAATIALPGLTPSEALAGIGIGSLAIGLAFKDIFENFLAGLLILLREPMRLGDYVECQDVSGTVEKISLRDTYLRGTDGALTMVPNAFLFKNPVEVLTDQSIRRQSITVGVAYGEDVDAARDVIKNTLAGADTVKPEKPVQIFAKEFGSSSVDFEVAWWSGSKPVEIRASRDEVVAAIKRGLDEAGVEIPFPYRTLTFKEPVQLAGERLQSAGE